MNNFFDYLKNISTADRLAYAGLMSAIIFGSWGIALTYKVINTSVDVQHFDTLLNKTDSSLTKQSQLLSDNGTLINLSQKQIDSLVSINKTLTKQFDVISKQYALNELQESDIKIEKQFERNSNWNRLLISTKLLSSGIQYYLRYDDYDSLRESDYLKHVSNILELELYNPVLMANDSIARYWMKSFDFIKMIQDEMSMNPNSIISTDGVTTSRGKDVKENVLKQDVKSSAKELGTLTVKCFQYIFKNSSEYKRLLR